MVLLPIDAAPDVTPNVVQVVTDAPGLGAVEVEKLITFPVEIAMRGFTGIKEIRSISRFGLSSVSVYFEENLDIYFARRLVMERLSAARELIPKGFGSPEMTPVSTTLGEIYQFEVVDPQRSLMELRSILDWQIAPALKSVAGVVEVNSFGGELKTYELQLRPDSLVAYGLGLKDVFQALERNNSSAGGGYIVHNGEQQIIRGSGLIGSLADVGNIVVGSRNRVPVYSLLLILVLLYNTFSSMRMALLIFGNVLFAASGGVLALYARGLDFSITAGVGFITLFGVSVLNGVVLVSEINRLRESGHQTDAALAEGTAEKLRPILMASLVALFGFIPMAVSHGAGAEVQRPLATVVIGGLITSAPFTHYMLPLLYRWTAGNGAAAASKNLSAPADV
jgi:Cu/Ag efflux pump CusA